MINIKRLTLAAAALTLTASVTTTQAASAAPAVTPLPCSPSHVDMLTYHGGETLINDSVDLIFWGSWWKSGDPRARKVMTELKSLFTGLGDSSWANTVTQYCWYNSDIGATYAPNPDNANNGSLLGSAVVDPSNPPPKPTDQNFTDEVYKEKPMDFYGFNVPMIVTPPGVYPTNGDCAYHGSGTEPITPVPNYYAWAVVPYAMASDVAGCQLHGRINIYGALSMLAGHEWAETVTDPFGGSNIGGSFSTSWTAQVGPKGTPASQIEIADLCQPLDVDGVLQEDITGKVQAPFSLKLSTGTFTMQTLWSNEAGPASQSGRCVKGS
jgi:hypothetical protein